MSKTVFSEKIAVVKGEDTKACVIVEVGTYKERPLAVSIRPLVPHHSGTQYTPKRASMRITDMDQVDKVIKALQEAKKAYVAGLKEIKTEKTASGDGLTRAELSKLSKSQLAELLAEKFGISKTNANKNTRETIITMLVNATK